MSCFFGYKKPAGEAPQNHNQKQTMKKIALFETGKNETTRITSAGILIFPEYALQSINIYRIKNGTVQNPVMDTNAVEVLQNNEIITRLIESQMPNVQSRTEFSELDERAGWLRVVVLRSGESVLYSVKVVALGKKKVLPEREIEMVDELSRGVVFTNGEDVGFDGEVWSVMAADTKLCQLI